MRRAIEQLDGELAKPVDELGDGRRRRGPPAPDADPWPSSDALVAQLHAVVATAIAPALRGCATSCAIACCRGARRREGLVGCPTATRATARRSCTTSGSPIAPQELHELGLAEIARTDRELAELGAKVLGTPDLAATIAKLRTDRALYFATREQILAAAQHALDRAKAAIPRLLLGAAEGRLRDARDPGYEAPFSTIAYYRQPHYDGSKPGEYFVNTYKPETRARFELEALTWHESIPGHHLQIAIAQELGALPAFRKLDGSTAFVEGWALYTERLAEEMGLYTSDLDRLGKLSATTRGARRGSSSTPGIHALGWTRAQAERSCASTPRSPRSTSRTRSIATSAGPARRSRTRSASSRSSGCARDAEAALGAEVRSQGVPRRRARRRRGDAAGARRARAGVDRADEAKARPRPVGRRRRSSSARSSAPACS